MGVYDFGDQKRFRKRIICISKGRDRDLRQGEEGELQADIPRVFGIGDAVCEIRESGVGEIKGTGNQLVAYDKGIVVEEGKAIFKLLWQIVWDHQAERSFRKI